MCREVTVVHTNYTVTDLFSNCCISAEKWFNLALLRKEAFSGMPKFRTRNLVGRSFRCLSIPMHTFGILDHPMTHPMNTDGLDMAEGRVLMQLKNRTQQQ